MTQPRKPDAKRRYVVVFGVCGMCGKRVWFSRGTAEGFYLSGRLCWSAFLGMPLHADCRRQQEAFLNWDAS